MSKTAERDQVEALLYEAAWTTETYRRGLAETGMPAPLVIALTIEFNKLYLTKLLGFDIK
jgi:hypothetical protein